MVVYINEEIRNGHRFFSKAWRDTTFSMPNLYLAEDLQDFDENRFSVRGTPWYTIFQPGRALKGKGCMLVMDSKYRLTEQPDVGKLMAEAMQRGDEALAQFEADWKYAWTDDSKLRASGKLDYEMWKIKRDIAYASRNAELYDGDTVVPIRSYFDIPDGITIRLAQLNYDPKLDFTVLAQCIASNGVFPRPPKGEPEKLTLADLVGRLYPIPGLSPA